MPAKKRNAEEDKDSIDEGKPNKKGRKTKAAVQEQMENDEELAEFLQEQEIRGLSPLAAVKKESDRSSPPVEGHLQEGSPPLSLPPSDADSQPSATEPGPDASRMVDGTSVTPNDPTSVVVNGKRFPLPFDDPVCDGLLLTTEFALREHLTSPEHEAAVNKFIREAHFDPEGALAAEMEIALRATILTRAPVFSPRDKLRKLASLMAVTPSRLVPASEVPLPAPATPTAGTTRLTKAKSKKTDAKAGPAKDAGRTGEDRGTKTALSSPPTSIKKTVKFTLHEKREQLEALLADSDQALSHSQSDGEEKVYVLDLERLLHHGKDYESIPLGAACYICIDKRTGPADLGNYHTLQKHLTGGPHKNNLRRELARVNKELSSDSGDGMSSEPSRRTMGSDSRTFHASSRPAKGDLSLGPRAAHMYSGTPAKGSNASTHYSNSLTGSGGGNNIGNSSSRFSSSSSGGRDGGDTKFGCCNLDCGAPVSAKAGHVQAKCGQCGLKQTVPRQRTQF